MDFGGVKRMTFKPTSQQLAAADPRASVWVTANAGSGKTHVLVERVIRLMLEGAEPASILCLTYTKAAASEMSSRLFKRLGEWISLSDAELTMTLNRLGAFEVEHSALVSARRLFTRALETPGGLKIQTIHAFCEKILHLFPVEAGLSPGFKLLSEREEVELRDSTIRNLLRSPNEAADPDLNLAIKQIVNETNIDGFGSLMREFLGGAAGYRALLENETTAHDYSLVMRSAAGLKIEDSSETIRAKINGFSRDEYDFHAMCLGSHKPHYGHDVAYLMLLAKKSSDPFSFLQEMAFTKGNEPSKRPFYSKDFASEFPKTAEFLDGEKSRIIDQTIIYDIHLRIEATAHLLTAANAIHQFITRHKQRFGVYDFDDLISATANLLNSSRATLWVLSKLDGGLKHILVDEAQDTSPKQWQIVKSLSDEFFAGLGVEREKPRTLFVVGDRKQSIFSFQGADATAMNRARQAFEHQASSLNQRLNDIDLSISYRSTQEILSCVDKVFPSEVPAQLGFSLSDKKEEPHQSSRLGETGVVEIWPLIEPLEEKEDQPWLTPVDQEPAQNPRRRLARQIASTLKSWIGKRVLIARKRTVQPEDILILLQSRGPLFSMLISELRKAGVPVAGADRLKLLESLVIQDLLILAQWLLLPADDHALACILKSPFVPKVLNEEELFELSYDRADKSLWQRLSAQADANFEYLHQLQILSKASGPHALFAHVLTQSRKAMTTRLGTEAVDATDAFLDQILSYELENGQSLAGFLHWFSSNETNLKREMEKASGEVRLMTVHGAKGLEANIVFLPDAASIMGNNSSPKLVRIPEGGIGAGLPIWKLGQLTSAPVLESWSVASLAKQQAERNRLLYVAMTRACDELYICGVSGKNKLPVGCWYETITKALCAPNQEGIQRFGAEPEFAEATLSGARQTLEQPAWMTAAPPAEQTPHVHGLTSLIQRNSKGYDVAAARRGIAIHALLQDLPDIAPEKRITFAQRKAKFLGLEETYANKLITLLNQPELIDFFGLESRAEAELRGSLTDGRKVAGRVDRIAVFDQKIAILDYKSDLVVPSSLFADHPYVSQMALYAVLLRNAYPDHEIKAALLWTQSAEISWLSSEFLAQGLEFALANLSPEAP
jgi:ATP-dependent helicase/nuclease subunit A